MSSMSIGTGLRHLVSLGTRFAIVGLGSVAVYFAFLYVLAPLIANTVVLTGFCYASSAVFNYALQSSFTFRSRAISARAASRYMAMHGLCMGLNSVLMHALVDRLGASLFLAQAGVTGIVAMTSFLLSYLWVYPGREAAT